MTREKQCENVCDPYVAIKITAYIDIYCNLTSKQTWGVGPTLVYSWANVVVGGPTINQRWANASCLLGV